MPGPARLRGHLADLAVSTRKVIPSTIDIRARNVLNFVQRASMVTVSKEESTRDFPEDHALNRELAADSVLLLKNDSSALPLKHNFESLALIGPNVRATAFCGGGSASLRPYLMPYRRTEASLSNSLKTFQCTMNWLQFRDASCPCLQRRISLHQVDCQSVESRITRIRRRSSPAAQFFKLTLRIHHGNCYDLRIQI